MGLVNACRTGASLVLAASSIFSHAAAGARTNITRSINVALPQGEIRGFHDDSSNSVFLGVPFAATTGGENRFVDRSCFLGRVLLTPSKVAGASGCPGVELNI